jgi:dihydrofolate reductase
MVEIGLVAAVSRNGIIGNAGGLPWRLPSDLKRFKALTLGKPVIMGRKTWDSLPRQPLPGRVNIIMTRDTTFRAEGAHCVSSVEDAVRCAEESGATQANVIGGGEIYAAFLPRAQRMYLSIVDVDAEGDTSFPDINFSQWLEVRTESVPQGEADSASFTLRAFVRNPPT